jgi:hypothetical protein
MSNDSSSSPSPETFGVRVEPGRIAPIRVPASEAEFRLESFSSRSLALVDFPLVEVRLDVMAGDSVLVAIPPIFERDPQLGLTCRFHWRFTDGILVRRDEEIGLRFEGPSALFVEVGWAAVEG